MAEEVSRAEDAKPRELNCLLWAWETTDSLRSGGQKSRNLRRHAGRSLGDQIGSGKGLGNEKCEGGGGQGVGLIDSAFRTARRRLSCPKE